MLKGENIAYSKEKWEGGWHMRLNIKWEDNLQQNKEQGKLELWKGETV